MKVTRCAVCGKPANPAIKGRGEKWKCMVCHRQKHPGQLISIKE